MPAIDLNGVSLHYEESGVLDGPAIVLIMGLGMQLVAWPAALLDALAARGYRVIRFDNRDIGLSSKFDHAGTVNIKSTIRRRFFRLAVSAPYTLDDMADDTVGLMDALDIKKATLLGVSMGGMIAQVIATRYPARVERLISIMSSTGSRKTPRPTAAALSALFAKAPEHADTTAQAEFYAGVASRIGSPGFPADVAEVRNRLIAAMRRSSHRQGMPRQFAAIAASGDRRKQLANIKAPTLVIHGSDDPLLPLKAGEQTAAAIPGAKLEIIAGMGHDLAPGVIPLILAAFDEHRSCGKRKHQSKQLNDN